MEHANLLRRNGWYRKTESKNLLTRVTGCFYTPPLIGRYLADAVLRIAMPTIAGRASLCLADPFCGDGRLVQWFLELAAARNLLNRTRWEVFLWDSDLRAVRRAKEAVCETATQLGAQIEVHASVRDTFVTAQPHFGRFDIVITNPPWDRLKPDRRELENLGKRNTKLYIEKLRSQSALLMSLYPLAQPSMKFSGWGVNLSRCGTEAALRFANPSGVVGIVCPASLLADQVSERLRAWIFEEFTVNDLAYFPAEARLFESVDQPNITAVVTNRKVRSGQAPRLSIFDACGQAQTRPSFQIDNEYLRPNGYRVPLQFGFDGLDLLSRLQNLPAFSSLEGKSGACLWAGRELDETSHKSFLTEKGHFLFTKGRNVDRFGISEVPRLSVRSKGGPTIPNTATVWRLAWRDVSRPSQKRRVFATLIPPGWVTGNSLNVAYFRDNNLTRLKALLAAMNSFVFEFQVRSYSATAHISLGTVRRARIPDLLNPRTAARLAHVADECLRRYPAPHPDFEAVVADAYGFCYRDFSKILSFFQQVPAEETSGFLEGWSTRLCE